MKFTVILDLVSHKFKILLMACLKTIPIIIFSQYHCNYTLKSNYFTKILTHLIKFLAANFFIFFTFKTLLLSIQTKFPLH